MKFLFNLALIAMLICQNALAQKNIDRVASLYSNTQVIGDITYKKVNGDNLKLDIYIPTLRLGEPPWVRYTETRKPTLIFFHGGGWQGGDKISRSLFLMPYVERGFVVVTANYRHIPDVSMSALVADTRAAMNWVYDNAAKYKMDTTKIVLSGESAGGHLCLLNGFLEDESAFAQEGITINRRMKAAAIVNWYGVYDLQVASKDWDADYLSKVLQGVDKATLLAQLSPSTYIDAKDPPVITIHGSEDKSANYEQAVLLHEDLNELNVANKFITIKGKKHGNFSPAEMSNAAREVFSFLRKNKIW
jgi:acetyl esterase/lipase